MTPQELLSRMQLLGARLEVRGNKLHLVGADRLPNALIYELCLHKAEVMEALAGASAAYHAGDIEPAPCTVPDCSVQGWSVELGGGRYTVLCASHRRELFARALALAREAGDQEALRDLTAPTACRLCGRITALQDEPCRSCAAGLSPLVQEALRLGAGIEEGAP